MSFTLAEADELRIPPELQGGRIYLSLEEPLYIAISPDNTGYTRLNPVSSADPNFETVYDWSELTFQNGSIPFGGNTTQVDQFGMPMLVTLSQTSSGFVGGRGLTLTRAEVFDSYQSTVPEAFQALVVKDGDGNPIRILAPRTAQPGDVATWMDEPVDDLWTKYTSQPFVYPGRVTSSTAVSMAVISSCTRSRPPASPRQARTRRSGRRPRRSLPPTASSRGRAWTARSWRSSTPRSTAGWRARRISGTTSPAYYQEGQRFNDYSAFFHSIGVEHDAYGFPYDDVNDQSGVHILDNSAPPSMLTISVT